MAVGAAGAGAGASATGAGASAGESAGGVQTPNVLAQLGPDGVHRERTPTYHCLLAEQLAGVTAQITSTLESLGNNLIFAFPGGPDAGGDPDQEPGAAAAGVPGAGARVGEAGLSSARSALSRSPA